MPEGSPRILLVDDEQAVQTLLTYPLRKEGYEVEVVDDGLEAIERFSEGEFDLVVLDVMMPGLDGIEVCRRIRALSNVPVIMLTARDDEFDKVLGLEIGADDYITKPFSLREFRSRVKAALRRAGLATPPPAAADSPSRIVVGDLTIDPERRCVSAGDDEITLTFAEFEILASLAANRGRVLSREQLLESVWGESDYRDPRTIDVHIRHLREKIEAEPAKPRLLVTVRGVGYSFRES